MVGNSVLHGSGARDKRTLNSTLGARRDVINAALNGANLITSAALAAYAIESLPDDRLPPRADVILLYPVTRLYVEHSHGIFSGAVAGLCRRSALMKSLPECAQAKAEPRIHDALRDAKNWVLARARCLMTQQQFLETLKYGGFRCQRLFQNENVTAGFLNEYRRTLGYAPFTRQDSDSLFRGGALFADANQADIAAAAAVGHVSSLKGLLSSRRIAARFFLIILRESPKFTAILTPAERASLDAAAANIAGAIRRKAPWIQVKTLGPYAPNDYYDPAHLREEGQIRLAGDILRLTQPDGASR